jgi:carboxypeptidase family protein
VTSRATIHASGKCFLLALLGCLFSESAAAQGVGQGTLVGVVVDSATKAPIPDVLVAATSPSLQGEQVAVTDATGTYRIPQLPPGAYLVRFEKETYRPFTRGEIALDADRTLRLNVELLPESLAGEEVLVLGETPVIDVGSTQTGMTITSDFVQNLPVAQANVSTRREDRVYSTFVRSVA